MHEHEQLCRRWKFHAHQVSECTVGGALEWQGVVPTATCFLDDRGLGIERFLSDGEVLHGSRQLFRRKRPLRTDLEWFILDRHLHSTRPEPTSQERGATRPSNTTRDIQLSLLLQLDELHGDWRARRNERDVERLAMVDDATHYNVADGIRRLLFHQWFLHGDWSAVRPASTIHASNRSSLLE
jgi:hypothetical protein